MLFDIKAVDVVLPNVQLYDCSYQSRGRTAKFRLQLRQNHPLSGEVIPVAAVEGKFLAVPDSDNSALLEDLMKALEAKELPSHSPGRDRQNSRLMPWYWEKDRAAVRLEDTPETRRGSGN